MLPTMMIIGPSEKNGKPIYQSFTQDKLLAMTDEDFFEYISRLWSMLIWGNKKYVVDKADCRKRL